MLKVENFTVSYGHVRAVKGISFEVAKGEIVTIIGANGAGKSSTVNGLAGIVESGGRVEFDGHDISRMPNYARVSKGLTLCPEGRHIFPELTVDENLRMGSYRRGSYSKGLGLVHDLFPVLKERKNQVSGYLSGGEQQMLAIGRALMADPKLLMLDEPSLGLAPILVDQVFASLERLRIEQGLSILLIEQNAFKALGISQRGYIMETGSITLEGNSKDLLESEDVKKAYLGI
ncbi:MAG TPA: ABC transporter ATP-binding protein [Bacillota bacterium]|nr:ABC transporter ATP-binding protein [Bacillota bacterium]HOA15358.1 ABC transporter ATP-binding protein [Bacillota bacterium]